MTQNDEGNMLAPMWLFDHVAACIRKGDATEQMAQNVEYLRAIMGTQAARIAELEASLQAVLRREEDANKAAFAHMRRAEAAEADVARLREALGDALDAWDTHNETGDMMQGYWVSDARAALDQKEAGE